MKQLFATQAKPREKQTGNDIMKTGSTTPHPLPPLMMDIQATATITSARESSSTGPAPKTDSRPRTAEQMDVMRRASQRGSARVPGMATSDKWPMNDTARAQLEAILGTSLSPGTAEGADALRAALDTHIGGLEHYVKLVKEFQDAQKQPDNDISLLDGRFAPHVAAMENIRHTHLGMRHFDGLPQFAEHLRAHLDDGKPLARRLLVRTGADEEETHHHVYIDVVNRNGKLSLIVLDSSNLYSPAVRHALAAIDIALCGLGNHPYVWSYLPTNSQNSENDCIPFSTSYGKKSGDEAAFMDSLHDKQLAGQPLHPSEPEQFMVEIERNAMEGKRGMHNVLVDTNTLLPLRFFKHLQPPGALTALLESRPEDSDTLVNKPKDDRPAQTLENRVLSHVPREGRERTGIKRLQRARTFYSLSIEEKRFTTASKTLELFRYLRDHVPVFV